MYQMMLKLVHSISTFYLYSQSLQSISTIYSLSLQSTVYLYSLALQSISTVYIYNLQSVSTVYLWTITYFLCVNTCKRFLERC